MTRSTRPTKAVLLAAGLGTRMRPLSYSVPKPLMPIWGVPCIDRMIALLQSWGVRDFLVNLHHAPNALFNHLRLKALRESIRIELSFEADILGTGGALAKAGWFIGQEPFWMANTDIVAHLTPAPLLKAFRENDAVAALWVTDASGPRTVEVDDDLRIHNFRSTHAGQPGTYTFSGLQLIAPALLSHVAQRGFSTVVAAYEAAMKAGQPVLGVSVPHSIWADAGRPETYIEAHKLLLDAKVPDVVRASRRCRSRLTQSGVEVTKIVSGDTSVVLSGSAAVCNCVVMNDVRLGRHAAITELIVGPGVSLDRALHGGIVCRAADVPQSECDDALLTALNMRRSGVLLHSLPGRGSDRSFTRLMYGRRSVMLVRYGQARPENRRYAGHARSLANEGLRVPEVILDDPRSRLTIFEDVGETSLLALSRKLCPRKLTAAYEVVLDSVTHLHALQRSTVADGLEPPFTRKLFAWEHTLFDTHFLLAIPSISAAQRTAICRELESVSTLLAATRRVLVHRDLQSSNLIRCRGEYVMIDFQGMRFGPAAYDLASLLCDPYVMLPQDVQETLLDTYRRKAGRADVTPDIFWAAAVQRLAQALGAYGRLSAVPGASRFSSSIPPALAMMRRAIGLVSVPLPQLRRLVDEEITRRST